MTRLSHAAPPVPMEDGDLTGGSISSPPPVAAAGGRP